MLAGLAPAGCGPHDWPGAGECADDGLDAVRHALRDVCTGVAHPEAGMPTGSPTRRVVLLAGYQDQRIAILAQGQEEWHFWSSCIPASWAPASIGDAELAVCVGKPSQNNVGECEGDDGSTGNRVETALGVTLRETRTGVVVQDTTLRHEPDTCPFFQSSASDMEAPPIEFKDVSQWLEPLLRRGP